ncbi:MAG: LysE family translocator [Pseudomonadota bacterium]
MPLALDAFVALVAFALVASITPGPNTLMLLASGVNFGWRRTLPHMFGICIGFTTMIFLVGLGFAGVFQRYPWAHDALRVVGIVYMLWLAWKIATSAGIGETSAAGRPFTFLQAAAFQWVNPKAWAIAVAAIGAYTVPDAYLTSVAVVALVFGAVGVPSVSTWTLVGLGVRRLLAQPRRIRVFNGLMALLLVLSLWPVVSEALQG